MDVVFPSPQSDQKAANGHYHTTQTVRLWDRKAEGGFPGTSTKDCIYPVLCFYEINAHWLSPHDSASLQPAGGVPGSLMLTLVSILNTIAIRPSCTPELLVLSPFSRPDFLSI